MNERNPGRALRVASRLLLLGAVGVDGFLAWHSVARAPIAGCGGTAGCDSILATSWGYFLGLPVSVLALFGHAALLALSTFSTPAALGAGHRRAAGIALGGAILLAAGWFIYVQAVILGHYCPFCLSDHALGSAGALLFLAALPRRGRAISDLPAWGIAVAVLVLLVGVQVLFPTQRIALHSTTPVVQGQLPGVDRIVTVSPGTLPASLSELPFLGDVQAPTIIVVLFDYTCPNCRRLHPLLQEALEKHSGKLCIILLPVPIAPGCNRHIENLLPEHVDACDYARLALALWRHNPDDFRAFTQQFVEPDAPAAPIAVARAWAQNRIGVAALNAALVDDWVRLRLQWDVEVFARLAQSSGQVEMPKVIIGNQIISGASSDYASFDALLQRYAGLH